MTKYSRFLIFQSTQPEWAATEGEERYLRSIGISIHAARVGCDQPLDSQTLEHLISIHAARVGCD